MTTPSVNGETLCPISQALWVAHRATSNERVNVPRSSERGSRPGRSVVILLVQSLRF